MKTKTKTKIARKPVKRKSKPVLRSKWIIAGVILVVVVILNAVSGGGVITAAKVLLGAVPTSTPIPTPTPADIVPYGGNLKQDTYTGMAKADLAKKLDMSANDIQVISITQKNWNDTSLGCPKRNQMYSQVITPGYIIVLQSQGKNYTYNVGLEKVVSCQ